MATRNPFALLDSDEEDNVVQPQKAVEKKSKPKQTSPKPSKAPVTKQNGPPPTAVAPPAGSGWGDDAGKQDGESRRRNDNQNRGGGRGGGRGGRVGMGGRNGRDFDRRSGTGRGREMKKGGAGGHNWGVAEEETAAQQSNWNAVDESPPSKDVEENTPQDAGETSEAPQNAEPVVEQPPPEPEVQQLTLDEFEAQKAAKARELAEQNELFEEREEVQVDEKDFQGLLRKEEDEDDEGPILTGKDKKKKGKKNSGREKILVTDVGFRPPPVERGGDGGRRGGRGGRGRGRGGDRREGGQGFGASVESEVGPLDLNAFPALIESKG